MKHLIYIILILCLSLILLTCRVYPDGSGYGSGEISRAGERTVETAEGIEFAVIYVPEGRVKSGMTWESSENYSLPQDITAFTIGETEVTYELWYAVKTWATTISSNIYYFSNQGTEGSASLPGGIPSTLEPVTTINWKDAIIWCNALSEVTGREPVYRDIYDVLRNSTQPIESDVLLDRATIDFYNGFRLPTEAEWEYAARGGLPSTSIPWAYIYAGSDDPNTVAVHSDGIPIPTTANVKSKNPNALGLYDMSGNVNEFCQDMDGNSDYVYRGGAGGDNPSDCTIAQRDAYQAPTVSAWIGFRVVRNPD